MKIFVAVLALAAIQLSSSQVIRLECKNSAPPNPLTCPQQQTCDDQQCGDANMVCCPVSTSGQCGFSCQIGEYLGCYETQWWCYGPQISAAAILPKRHNGPAFFIDNQDAVLDIGHAAQIEYIATRAGVEITFMLLAAIDGTEHNYRQTAFEIKHTAAAVGKQVVPVNWRIQQGNLRLAYKVETAGEFPIPYDTNKADNSGPYHSFIDPVVDGQVLRVQNSQQVAGGINMRFQARICLNAEAEKVDDDICGYVQPTSPTTSTTTSATTSATTTDEGPDPLCELRKIPQYTGCIGQAAPQYHSDFTQTATGGSYSNVDMIGELRDGNITSIEYHAIRLAPIVFQVWEETPIPSAMFILRHQMLINPTAINQLVSIDLDAAGKVMEVKNKWRYGFTYITQNGQTHVPIQYRVINVYDDLVDTGRPYVSAECKESGCGVGVALGQEVDLTDRQHLFKKQFNIRPCMTTYEWVEVCEN